MRHPTPPPSTTHPAPPTLPTPVAGDRRVRPERWGTVTSPVVIGHRGMGISHGRPQPRYPENTRASFAAAHAAGAHWVELDLLPSADGDLIIHHDNFVATDHGPEPIWTLPTETLLARGCELLDGLADDLPAGLGLYLEAKVAPGDADPARGPGSMAALIDWATTTAADRPVLVASFDPYAVLDARDAGLPTGWITTAHQPVHTVMTAAVRASHSAVIVHGPALDAPVCELALATDMGRDHDIALWTWGPDPSRIEDYRRQGVVGFCVDDVAATVAHLRHA